VLSCAAFNTGVAHALIKASFLAELIVDPICFLVASLLPCEWIGNTILVVAHHPIGGLVSALLASWWILGAAFITAISYALFKSSLLAELIVDPICFLVAVVGPCGFERSALFVIFLHPIGGLVRALLASVRWCRSWRTTHHASISDALGRKKGRHQ
jgi:hypothetical protein